MGTIKIDISRLQNQDGTYSSNDLNVLERATGKTAPELIAESQNEFTEEEIENMSHEEFGKNREAILKSMAEGRID